MNDSTRPPLYAYQEAYKTTAPASFDGRFRRTQRFTDDEYNEMISLMGSAYRATVDGKHNFVISCNQGGRLKQLLKDSGIVQPASITVLLGQVRLNYPINKNGVAQCTADLKKIQEMIEGGVITSYDDDNPLKAQNINGKYIKNLTKSNNYSNTVYTDKKTGETKRVSQNTAQNIDELLSAQAQESQRAKIGNYVLIGIVLLAVIVMIWVVKKNK